MGCTESEWLSWLPGAVGSHALVIEGPQAQVGAFLRLSWQVMPPRTIALLSIARLAVRFEFTGLTPIERQAFMKQFDLFMQRGGG
ncbi:MAG: hypothetical protein ACO22S_04615 [Burkholderiaceae bacterium]|jgi:hypothetical protein